MTSPDLFAALSLQVFSLHKTKTTEFSKNSVVSTDHYY